MSESPVARFVAVATVLSWMAMPIDDEIPFPSDADQPPPPVELREDQGHEPFRQLKAHGSSLANCCRVLEDDDLRELVLGPGRLRFNEMTQSAEFDGGPVDASVVVRFRLNSERRIFGTATDGTKDRKVVAFAEDTVYSAFHAASLGDRYHPVREYLDGLIHHPTTESAIERAASEALHLPEGLPRILWRKFLIGAVARATEPGCKVDTVPVFIGPGSFGKSTMLRVLASDAWFRDTRMDLGNMTRSLMQLSRSWIYEWSEMTSMKSAKTSDMVKDFISSQVDSFVPLYGRLVEDRPRSCVIAGTTNQRDFLTDETGNRRFWPIEITQPIDVQFFRTWRDEIWAEAVSDYRAQEPWWLNDEQDSELAGSHREFEDHDAWEPLIKDWLIGKDEIRMTDLLSGALGLDKSRQGTTEQRRTAKVLVRSGWEACHRRRDGKMTRVWARKS